MVPVEGAALPTLDVAAKGWPGGSSLRTPDGPIDGGPRGAVRRARDASDVLWPACAVEGSLGGAASTPLAGAVMSSAAETLTKGLLDDGETVKVETDVPVTSLSGTTSAPGGAATPPCGVKVGSVSADMIHAVHADHAIVLGRSPEGPETSGAAHWVVSLDDGWAARLADSWANGRAKAWAARWAGSGAAAWAAFVAEAWVARRVARRAVGGANAWAAGGAEAWVARWDARWTDG